MVYAEILHNVVLFRKVMGFFFENFITDRHSILYSHFTVENSGSGLLRLKMYFYDGIIEEKMSLLERHLKRFRKKNKRRHKYVLRRFRKVRAIRRLRTGFLRGWRYYDYMLARQIIFYFIYYLNMGPLNMTGVSRIRVLKFFYTVVAEK